MAKMARAHTGRAHLVRTGSLHHRVVTVSQTDIDCHVYHLLLLHSIDIQYLWTSQGVGAR